MTTPSKANDEEGSSMTMDYRTGVSDVRMGTFRVPLTDDELRDDANDAARLDAEIDQAEEAANEARKAAKLRIDEMCATRAHHLRRVREGQGDVDLRVQQIADWDEGYVRTVVADGERAGLVVDTRKISDVERQLRLEVISPETSKQRDAADRVPAGA